MKVLSTLQPAADATRTGASTIWTGEGEVVKQGDPEAVRKIVTDYLKEQDEQKKRAEEQKEKEAEEQGSVVGSDLGMRFRWHYGPGSFSIFLRNKVSRVKPTEAWAMVISPQAAGFLSFPAAILRKNPKGGSISRSWHGYGA
jgi:hypothetical protein